MVTNKKHDQKQTDILAPLSGVLVPLESVPDPVFAERMVGDGIAIDPLDHVLRSPCDGEITQLHPAGHAVTVQTADGVEVLMHIGLDTVELKGKGFSPKVREGDRVSTGTALIEFDLDGVATNAKSALTLVVVTTMEKVGSLVLASGTVDAGKDRIFSFGSGNEVEAPAVAAEGQRIESEEIVVPNPTGLHARPAAVLANAAKTFHSDLRLRFGEKEANAKSVTSIMSLDVRQGAAVTVVAHGADAAEAIGRLSEMLGTGLGDEGCKPGSAPASEKIESPKAAQPMEDPDVLSGAAASPGLGVGNVFQVRHEEVVVEEDAEDPEQEHEALHSAIRKAKGQLDALQAKLQAGNDPAKAAIFAAHSELLEDPDIVEIAASLIAKGKTAAFAWKWAYATHSDRLADMENELLAQRANDLRDVGERVLELLAGVEPRKLEYPEQAILIAEDLTPSDTASLDQSRVMGFCTTRGGATSHVAILARSLGIPAIAGISPLALEVADGTPVILDGGRGMLRLNPSEEEQEEIRVQLREADEKHREDLAHAQEPAVTLDGHRIEVAANVGGLEDARQIAGLGGEGVGLLRSEFLFMERSTAPTEDEQFEAYKSIAEAIGPDESLIIRTLDVGGDKPLAYLPIPTEDNPFLGERGIRVGLDRPEILRTQIRAILRASKFGKLRIMFPMVGTVPELRRARAIVNEECERLGVSPIPVGIMVEVPSAAVMAGQFAKEADFFSIGTNDLTQYTLAMDRGHPKFAPQVDGLNPAVLRLISQSVEGAQSHDRWVGVCGGIAADPQAVPILLGLGIDELSVSLPAIPAVKAQIRSLDQTVCKKLAEEALECATAREVRALVSERTIHSDSSTLVK